MFYWTWQFDRHALHVSGDSGHIVPGVLAPIPLRACRLRLDTLRTCIRFEPRRDRHSMAWSLGVFKIVCELSKIVSGKFEV
jgi:hypothetical protein